MILSCRGLSVNHLLDVIRV